MRRFHTRSLLVLLALPLSACGVPTERLVHPPLVYTLGHAPSDHPEVYHPTIDVFFATTRAPSDGARTDYGNRASDQISVGRARVAFGEGEWTPDDIRTATHDEARPDVPLFLLEHVVTDGVVARVGPDDWETLEGSAVSARFLRQAVEATEDRSLLVYVDGAKGNFYRSCALAAEIRHLTGRTMPVLVFAWPSHQNIFSYIFGGDEQVADDSGLPFAALVDWLAAESGAQNIHVLSYSAGGRVASIGLAHLRERHADLQGDALRARAPLGTVVFAAADEPVDRFIMEAPLIHEMADRIIVTICQADHALRLSHVLNGEHRRISSEPWEGPTPEEMQLLRQLAHVEFVDVSRGHEARGFDIEGHGYWYRQPWVISDVIMALRTGRSGGLRGLHRESGGHIYSFNAMYPQRLGEAAATTFPPLEPRD